MVKSCHIRSSKNSIERGAEFLSLRGQQRHTVKARCREDADESAFREEGVDAGLEFRRHESASEENDRHDRQTSEPGRKQDGAGKLPAAEVCLAGGPRPEREPTENKGGDERADGDADNISEVSNERDTDDQVEERFTHAEPHQPAL